MKLLSCDLCHLLVLLWIKVSRLFICWEIKLRGFVTISRHFPSEFRSRWSNYVSELFAKVFSESQLNSTLPMTFSIDVRDVYNGYERWQKLIWRQGQALYNVEALSLFLLFANALSSSMGFMPITSPRIKDIRRRNAPMSLSIIVLDCQITVQI